ncbi:hypothetical protein M569_05542, partial [Genlisea aurea]
LGFTALLLLLLPFLILFNSYLKRRRRPPGPPGLPLIGNLFQLDQSEPPHIHLWQLAKKYGPIMRLKFGSVPVLVVSSSDMAEEVLKTHDLVFCSRPKLLGQQKLTYDNSDVAFTPYGDSWRELRKICVLHLLSNKQVQSFSPIREDEVQEMMKKISAHASRGEVANLSSIAVSFTSNLICRVAFGMRSDENWPCMEKFDELMLESQAMQGGFFVSDYMPLFGWVDRFSGMIDRLERVSKELDEFYEKLIDAHLDPDSSASLKNDLLAILIQLKANNSSPVDITWENIKGILLDILAGGTDTSATTIVWAMTTLMQNPEIMSRLGREVRDAVGIGGKATEDDVSKCPYLKAVVKEILRMYPPAPLLIPRESQKDCVIRGYEIEAKTMVYVNAWAIGRDPENWENPQQFIPERFLNGEADLIGKNFEAIPFGAGRRVCPGISTGLATVELALANLIYGFDWELPNGMEIKDIDTDVTPGITIAKKVPLCLVPKKFQ